MREWSIASHIFNIGIKWNIAVGIMPQLLQSPGKNPQAPLNRKLDGPQSWSGQCAEKKNVLPLPRIEPRYFFLFIYLFWFVRLLALCQSRVIVKMIVEKQMECRLAGETEVLGENLPQCHFCPSQNPT
jgi:hypothetical protein